MEQIQNSWEAYEPLKNNSLEDWEHDERANFLLARSMHQEAQEKGIGKPGELGEYTRHAARIAFISLVQERGVNETMLGIGYTFDDPMYNAYKYAAELILNDNIAKYYGHD